MEELSQIKILSYDSTLSHPARVRGLKYSLHGYLGQ